MVTILMCVFDRAVLGKCSSENVTEDDFKACIAKYAGKKDVRDLFCPGLLLATPYIFEWQLMDPDKPDGYHSMGNTHSMYVQPPEPYVVIG
jgi:hypothetical protein